MIRLLISEKLSKQIELYEDISQEIKFICTWVFSAEGGFSQVGHGVIIYNFDLWTQYIILV